MLRKGMTHVAALALVAVLLAGTPAAAAGLGGLGPVAGAEPGDGSFWSRAWLWLDSLLSTAACGGDRGACIDPNGLAACGGDHSGCIDPNGAAAACGGDRGMCIDPNG